MQTMQQESNETASTTETEEPVRPIAELQLSTLKTNYTAKEEIPLQVNIQNGKFDLLVPFFAVATKGAFTQVTVKGVNGQIVEPKRAITQENPQKYVQQVTVKGVNGQIVEPKITQENPQKYRWKIRPLYSGV